MTQTYLDKIQHGLSPKQRLDQIVEHGMCIGCGLCQSIAGDGVITMAVGDDGSERPVVNGSLGHEIVNKIVDVCPGTRVEGLPDELIDDNTKQDSVWGAWREIVLAYAADPQIRHIGSTGGLMTALGLYLIESSTVDFIVHATESKTNPTFGERFISRNGEDVLKAVGSRYGATATLIDIHQILDGAENDNEKFALMGTPCDISALRNLARHDQRVNKYCKYMITMVCGGFMAPASMRNFLKSLNVDLDDVKSLRYRGHGCPGPTRIEKTNGEAIEKNYLDFWGEDESAWSLPLRCKICPDGIGDSADIACSDTWDGGSPTWKGQETDPGTNAAVVRTSRGVALMQDAREAGYIVTGDQITPLDMNRFQPHQENKKRTVWARFAGMKNAGSVVPVTNGLRLKSLAKENDLSFNLNESRGARLRVKKIKANNST